MAMTRKDFVAVAEVFRKNIEGESSPARKQALRWCASDLAVVFAKSNPNFDEDRFLKAANVRAEGV